MNNYTDRLQREYSGGLVASIPARKIGFYRVVFEIQMQDDWSIAYWDGRYWYGVNHDGELYDSDFRKIDTTPIDTTPPATREGEDIRKENVLVPVLKEYIALLDKELGRTFGMAHIHGYVPDPVDVQKGIELRVKIESLSTLPSTEGKTDKGWVALFKDESEFIKYLNWRKENNNIWICSKAGECGCSNHDKFCFVTDPENASCKFYRKYKASSIDKEEETCKVLKVNALETVYNAVEEKFNRCIKSDIPPLQQWREGYQAAQDCMIDAMLTSFGYDPKRLETNGVLLIKNLISKAQLKLEEKDTVTEGKEDKT